MTNEEQSKIFERMQMKLEKEIFERIEDVVSESKSRMKKLIIVVVVICMIMLCFSKFIV